MLAYMKAAPDDLRPALPERPREPRRARPQLLLPPARPRPSWPCRSPAATCRSCSTRSPRTSRRVTIQGQLTYRVADPRQLAALLDFSIRPNGKYRSDDPEKLPERLVQTRADRSPRAIDPAADAARRARGSDAIVAEVIAAACATPSPSRMLGRRAARRCRSSRSSRRRRWRARSRPRRASSSSARPTRRSTRAATPPSSRSASSRRASSTPSSPSRRSSAQIRERKMARTSPSRSSARR